MNKSNYTIYVNWVGDNFYPSQVKQKLNIPIKILCETGVITPIGRYRGMPSPFGMAVYEFPVINNDLETSLEQCCQTLLQWQATFAEAGAEELAIDIGIAKNCKPDMLLYQEIMDMIATLRATIEFHTYHKAKEIIKETQPVKQLLQSFKTNHKTVLQQHFNLEATLSTQAIPQLITPIKIDLIGKNQQTVFAKSINLDTDIHRLESQLAQILLLKDALTQAKETPKAFLITAEPSKNKPKNHAIWQQLLHSSSLEYIDVNDASKIIEYAKTHGVEPLFPATFVNNKTKRATK